MNKPTGYYGDYGYWGRIGEKWELYATEEEYLEAWREFYGESV